MLSWNLLRNWKSLLQSRNLRRITYPHWVSNCMGSYKGALAFPVLEVRGGDWSLLTDLRVEIVSVELSNTFQLIDWASHWPVVWAFELVLIESVDGFFVAEGDHVVSLGLDGAEQLLPVHVPRSKQFWIFPWSLSLKIVVIVFVWFVKFLLEFPLLLNRKRVELAKILLVPAESFFPRTKGCISSLWKGKLLLGDAQGVLADLLDELDLLFAVLV